MKIRLFVGIVLSLGLFTMVLLIGSELNYLLHRKGSEFNLKGSEFSDFPFSINHQGQQLAALTFKEEPRAADNPIGLAEVAKILKVSEIFNTSNHYNLANAGGKQRKVITVAVKLEGRLGNQLFEIAACYGIAADKRGKCCVLGLLGSMADQFCEFIDYYPQNDCDTAGWPYINEGKAPHNTRFKPEIQNVSQDTMIGTYLQAWGYFHHRGVPFRLKDLAFRDQFVDRDLCVHVRRGDYGNTVNIEYLSKAVSLFSTLVQPVFTMLAISDNPEWLMEQDLFHNATILTGATPGQAMAAIGACTHTIISIGTFGWWGAYFKRSMSGVVIYPRHIYDGCLPNDNGCEEHFLPHWIGVDV